MKRTRRIIGVSLIVLAIGSCIGISIYPKLKTIEKHGPPPEDVAAILPNDLVSAEALIAAVFNDWSEFDRPGRIGAFPNKFAADSTWSHFFLFRNNHSQGSVFPTDDQLLLNRGADFFVERYLQIPADLRAHDLYLDEPSGDYYRPSEYFYRGKAARFRCSFLIHLEPSGNSMAKVEIFEYQPAIWAGEYLGFSAHSIGPAILHDIRLVEPTTADRRVLLNIIQTAALPLTPR